MKFSIKDFFSKCDQIRRKLWIWSHLLKKSLMENVIFLCSVSVLQRGLLKLHNCFGFQDWFVDSGTIFAGSVSQAFEVTLPYTYIKRNLMLLLKGE